MNKKRFFTCISSIIFFLLIVSGSNAQKFDSLLNILDTRYPQERIYMHYDKPYYNPGETIWFKSYIFSGAAPSSISTTMYAELITDKGKIIDRKTIPVFGTTGASSLDIPDSLKSSLVYVRAYTSWMLNFDSSFLYMKPVRIIIPDATVVKKKEPSWLLNFFPEGGDMVAGIESRIAFKATDDDGLPVKMKGDIVDSKGQKIVSFSDIHDGMGYFSFKPASGEKYKAVWKDSKGVIKETPLPAAKEKGVVLNMNIVGNSISYTLFRTVDVPANYKILQVVGQMQQQPVYIAKINMTSKESVTAPIDVEGVTDGIMQLTIFTEDGLPIAERIVFINHHNYYFLTDLHITDKNLTRKGKNTIQIDVGDTLMTDISISVTDAVVSPTDKEEGNIFSGILLTSDIKGFVYDPAYYFSNTSDSVQTHLDLVMMTNGWRRFKWDDVVAGKWATIKNYPQPYLTVTGNVLGLLPSELSGGKELSFIVSTKKGNGQFLTTPVNNKGEFALKEMFFFDTARLYYQFNNDKEKRLTSGASFSFKNSFLTVSDRQITNLRSFLKPVLPDSSIQKRNAALNKLRQEEFFEGIKVKELEAVKVIARTKSPQQKMDEDYTSGFFTGGDSRNFITADDPLAQSAQSVLQYLQGKVAGLQITTNGPTGGSLTWRGSATSLFLNETNADISMIQSISMSDVAMIKVFPPPFYGASGGGAGGAVAVYMKKGQAANSDVKGLSFVSVAGYTPIKEFYSPDYSKEADVNKNDYRTTLFWSPHLVFDKRNRRMLISFYNNDNAKKIRVVLEGVNEQGKLTREEKFFE
ncbi:MAG: hypothetical protein WDN26_17080 [Chitinophagaceae bacterium]